MEVYFIRHGETDFNKQHRHQYPDTPLNETGLAQAHTVAELVPQLHPSHLIASTLTRAQQTAKIISTRVGLPIIPSAICIEIQRPGTIRGLHYAHPRSMWYLIRWFLSGRSYYATNGHGESYGSLIARVEAMKRELESYPVDARIVVVSHSVFINFFVAHCCSSQPISFLSAFLRLAKIIRLENSSITHVRYNESAHPGVCAWSVERFGEDKHVQD
jgi:broad specificity phosphatase PhoE